MKLLEAALISIIATPSQTTPSPTASIVLYYQSIRFLTHSSLWHHLHRLNFLANSSPYSYIHLLHTTHSILFILGTFNQDSHRLYFSGTHNVQISLKVLSGLAALIQHTTNQPTNQPQTLGKHSPSFHRFISWQTTTGPSSSWTAALEPPATLLWISQQQQTQQQQQRPLMIPNHSSKQSKMNNMHKKARFSFMSWRQSSIDSAWPMSRLRRRIPDKWPSFMPWKRPALGSSSISNGMYPWGYDRCNAILLINAR